MARLLVVILFLSTTIVDVWLFAALMNRYGLIVALVVIIFPPVGALAPLIAWVALDGMPAAVLIAYIIGVSLAVLIGRGRRSGRAAAPRPDIARHVPLLRDGRGMTVMFWLDDPASAGQHDTRWQFDPGVREHYGEMVLHLDIRVEQIIAEMEREMGLPVSFPTQRRDGE